MVNMKKGILRSYDVNNYRAAVELTGSGKVYLEDVAVARSIPSGEMVIGRKVAIVFFDEHNARDAVVIGVY